jgi:translation initiation factor 1
VFFCKKISQDQLMSKNDYKLVYSSDGSRKNTCQICKLTPCKCKKVEKFDPSQITLKMRLEKNGRGGKTVTVIFDLPHDPDYFAKLTKGLKNQCGTGGTYKDERIEIQGDQKIKVSAFLQNLGFKVKQSGA